MERAPIGPVDLRTPLDERIPVNQQKRRRNEQIDSLKKNK